MVNKQRLDALVSTLALPPGLVTEIRAGSSDESYEYILTDEEAFNNYQQKLQRTAFMSPSRLTFFIGAHRPVYGKMYPLLASMNLTEANHVQQALRDEYTEKCVEDIQTYLDSLD